MARKETTARGRYQALEARLERVEALLRSNRHELDIQLQRIADLQALLDSPLVERRRRLVTAISPRTIYARQDS